MSTRWKPEDNFLFKLSKDGKISFKHCLQVRWQVAIWWEVAFLEWCLSRKKFIAYCLGRDATQRWCHLMILSRCYGMLELLYFILILFFFFFNLIYFLDNEEVCDCNHMTHHMTLDQHCKKN